MSKFIAAVFMFFVQIRWRLALAAARSVSESYCECGMGYTSGHFDAMQRVHHLEGIGIRQGWLSDNDRTVRSRR